MFIGEYNHNLDDKGRLAIPAKFRAILKKGAVVTKGLDNCLFLYSKEQFETIAKKFAALPISQAKARAFSRHMLAGAMDVEFDKVKKEMISEEEYQKLRNQVENDFVNLKQFTENASHEIQTPLAIIKNKSELLLQQEELDKETVKEIVSINEAATRLSKLNQALLQLMKIDNRQYQESEKIDLSGLLEIKLQRLNELIEMKNIKLKTSIDKNVFIYMNVSLAEILLSNLLNNSIKHNIFGGEIIISLMSKELSIKNTGESLRIDPQKLFDRFVKESTSNESIGLGLSLVKQICETYNFVVSYNYEHSMHELKINFCK